MAGYTVERVEVERLGQEFELIIGFSPLSDANILAGWQIPEERVQKALDVLFNDEGESSE